MTEFKNCRVLVRVTAGKHIELVFDGAEGAPEVGLTPAAGLAIAEALVQAATMLATAETASEAPAKGGAASRRRGQLPALSSPGRNVVRRSTEMDFSSAGRAASRRLN